MSDVRVDGPEYVGVEYVRRHYLPRLMKLNEKGDVTFHFLDRAGVCEHASKLIGDTGAKCVVYTPFPEPKFAEGRHVLRFPSGSLAFGAWKRASTQIVQCWVQLHTILDVFDMSPNSDLAQLTTPYVATRVLSDVMKDSTVLSVQLTEKIGRLIEEELGAVNPVPSSETTTPEAAPRPMTARRKLTRKRKSNDTSEESAADSDDEDDSQETIEDNEYSPPPEDEESSDDKPLIKVAKKMEKDDLEVVGNAHKVVIDLEASIADVVRRRQDEPSNSEIITNEDDVWINRDDDDEPLDEFPDVPGSLSLARCTPQERDIFAHFLERPRTKWTMSQFGQQHIKGTMQKLIMGLGVVNRQPLMKELFRLCLFDRIRVMENPHIDREKCFLCQKNQEVFTVYCIDARLDDLKNAQARFPIVYKYMEEVKSDKVRPAGIGCTCYARLLRCAAVFRALHKVKTQYDKRVEVEGVESVQNDTKWMESGCKWINDLESVAQKACSKKYSQPINLNDF